MSRKCPNCEKTVYMGKNYFLASFYNARVVNFAFDTPISAECFYSDAAVTFMKIQSLK